jgi:hypothetical protein
MIGSIDLSRTIAKFRSLDKEERKRGSKGYLSIPSCP